MSKNKSKIETEALDSDDEVESQFILRLPEDVSKEVLAAMQAGTIHEKLAIDLNGDMRYGSVHMNGEVLHAKVVDLPTIVESYKTEDRVNLYKTADISQMVVCSRGPLKEPEVKPSKLAMKELEKILMPDSKEDKEDKENNAAKQGAIKKVPVVDETFLWPDGITPPTRNLRARRIANAMKNKNGEPMDKSLLKDVKKLFRKDSKAVSGTYELVEDDAIPDLPENIDATAENDNGMKDNEIGNEDNDFDMSFIDDDKENEAANAIAAQKLDEELAEIVNKLFP